MAFSNIENSEKLDIINIAIVDNEDLKNNEIFKESFKTLSDENNENRLFNTRYVTKEDAQKLLEDDEITIIVDLKMGDAMANAWGCDLTYEYVRINGSYRS